MRDSSIRPKNVNSKLTNYSRLFLDQGWSICLLFTSYCLYFCAYHRPNIERKQKILMLSALFPLIRILGPTALLQLADKKDSLPSIKRPLYTQAMVGTVVVFSGFRAKEDELVNPLFMLYTYICISLSYIYDIFFL